jgi:predicted metalloenzyme YecM
MNLGSQMFADQDPLDQPFAAFASLLMERLCSRFSARVSEYQIDHVCYRVETLERYAWVKGYFSARGTLLAETPYAGRPIAVFRLERPVVSGNLFTQLVELPAPKVGSPYREGWEHAEIVIHETLESFMRRFPGDWKTAALAKRLNPEIALSLGDGISVKFHRIALDEVVRLEREFGVLSGA